MENIKIIDNLSPDRWEEYKNLRLESLEDSPVAFGVSVDEDKTRTDAVWVEKLEKSIRGNTRFSVFAEDQGKLVGLICAYVDPLVKIKHTAHIASVYVNKAYRGSGVATKIMEGMINRIKSNKNINRLELMVVTTQEPAISLYKKFGFEIVGTVHKNLSLDGVYYDEHIMEKFI